MTYKLVSSSSALQSAISTASGGDVIALAPGVYTNVSFFKINPSIAVTIQSQYSQNPAYVQGLTVSYSSNLNINNIVLDASKTVIGSYGGEYSYASSVVNSHDIHFSYMTAKGTSGVDLAHAVTAMNIETDSNISIAHSSFSNFHNAIQVLGVNGFTGNSNTFTNIFDDGYRGGGTSNVQIASNTFTNFHQDLTDTDHPDTIQFWTNNTTTSASNFYIANNTYTRGNGAPVQGIFITDDHGGLPFLNVRITGNNYSGSLWNGIRVDGGKSVTISSNKFTSYMDNWTAIEVYNVSGGTVNLNQAFKYIYGTNNYLTISGNTTLPQVALPGGFSAFHMLQGQFADELQIPLSPEFPLGSLGAPEPAAWLMMTIGVAAIGLLLRRGAHREVRRLAPATQLPG